jgi:hypothetical protein
MRLVDVGWPQATVALKSKESQRARQHGAPCLVQLRPGHEEPATAVGSRMPRLCMGSDLPWSPGPPQMTATALIGVIWKAYAEDMVTRFADPVIRAVGMTGSSMRLVSPLWERIGVRINTFVEPQAVEEWPHLARWQPDESAQGGANISVVTIGVNDNGVCEVLGTDNARRGSIRLGDTGDYGGNAAPRPRAETVCHWLEWGKKVAKTEWHASQLPPATGPGS